MKRNARKILAMVVAMVMLMVGLPVTSFAESITAQSAFSFSGESFVSSDWTATNNTPTFSSEGISLSHNSSKKYATVTYKDSYDLSGGFELSYSARGRKSFNNIYDDTYYVGAKIGNITVAMNQYIKPVIMINDTVVAAGNAIIAFDSSNPIYNSSQSDAYNIRMWISDSSVGELSFADIKYTVTYAPSTNKITYSKYHDSDKVFELTYTDNTGLVDVSAADIALYHNNSYSFNATYNSISLDVEQGIPDLTGMPGGQCGDNANWAFDEASGTLYIVGEGATYNYVNVGDTVPWCEYRTQITKVVVGDDITYLGNRLFKGHNRITAAKFGKSVKSIGYEIFYLCNRLEKIQLNEGLTNLGALTFYNCTALKEVSIPSTVTDIANRAFKGSGLTSVVVPDTVKKTGYEVFMNCADLASVDFTEGVSMLNPCTFMNCTSLTEFNFTDNMCRIRSNAFSGCTALKFITFENEAMMWGSSNGQEAKIASDAFTGCNSTLKLVATKGSHVENYANARGFTFVDKTTFDPNAFDGTEGRTLVWYDEFDGTSLDTSTKWKFNQTMGASDRRYQNNSDHVSVSDSQLTLTAKKYSSFFYPNANYSLPQGLTTMDRMNFTYGYLEMRAKVPFQRGAWPSFWMKSDTRYGEADYLAEIDIFEAFASSNTLNSTLHKWECSPTGATLNHVQWQETYKGIDRTYTFDNYENLSNEFHLYGFEWTPEYMAFYVDNNLYLKIPITENKDFGNGVLPGMQGFHDPCYIIMNNELITQGNYDSSWMSSSWLCQDSDLPINYVIDYVRLYQKDGETIQTDF